MNRSLRFRILTNTTLSAVIVMGLLGAGVYIAMRHALMREFDASLESRAKLVASMVERNEHKISVEIDPQQLPEFVSRGATHFFEVWTADGRAVARSPMLADRDLPRGPNGLSTITLANGHAARAFTAAYLLKQDEENDAEPHTAAPKVIICVAAEPQEVFRTLSMLAGLLAVLCTLAIVVMGMLLLRVVSQDLRPLTTMATQIESLRESDLTSRLPADRLPSELLPVVEKLNGLLGRLESAFVREKSFTADVSHELRTPLAGLRATIDVCRSRPRDTAAYVTALDECRQITDRMESMVESLLLLARSESGQLRVSARRIDLSGELICIWQSLEEQANARGLDTQIDLPGVCELDVDPDKLRIVLRNLLENAVSHVDDGGRIQIKARNVDGAAIVEILNSGSQVNARDAHRVFERFWRGDSSRTGDGAHCGLGLSLTKRLVEMLGGQISIETARGGDFVATLKLGASTWGTGNGTALRPVERRGAIS